MWNVHSWELTEDDFGKIYVKLLLSPLYLNTTVFNSYMQHSFVFHYIFILGRRFELYKPLTCNHKCIIMFPRKWAQKYKRILQHCKQCALSNFLLNSFLQYRCNHGTQFSINSSSLPVCRTSKCLKSYIRKVTFISKFKQRAPWLKTSTI